MSSTYEVIVLGLGGMGSATTYHLARRGRHVLGLEAFALNHTNGSSHGQTRIIREAYAEGSDYVPIVQRAYALWRELEAEAGERLLTISGGLTIGPADNTAVTGVIASARAHGLPIEQLGPAEVAARFPGFRLTDDLVAIYQPNSGYLFPERCLAAHAAGATRHGADLHFNEPARRWAADGEGVVVETDQGRYHADRLVITAGPWAPVLLANLGLPLQVTRMYNVYFEPSQPERFAPERCPIYGWKVPEGEYYGFPALPGQGLKIGRHDSGEPCTAETARREVTEAEIAAFRAVLDRYMPGATGAIRATATCLYTNSADHHFIIDRLPAHPQVAYATGCSGHAFKFTSVIGEILADLTTGGATTLPIGFLAADRFTGT